MNNTHELFISLLHRLTAFALKLINGIEREFPRHTEVSQVVVDDAARWLMAKQKIQGQFEEEALDAPRKVREEGRL